MAMRKAVALAGVVAGVFACYLRPRLLRWGATDEEVAGPYPGAEVVPDGERAATMAITIEAPPDRVWPWLVQMGWDRGGRYSWDRVDNAGRPSATTVHPEWQALALGDQLRAWSPNGLLAPWTVAALEPNRFLGLHKLTDLRGRSLDPRQPRPPAYMEGLWGFQLSRAGPDTRHGRGALANRKRQRASRAASARHGRAPIPNNRHLITAVSTRPRA